MSTRIVNQDRRFNNHHHSNFVHWCEIVVFGIIFISLGIIFVALVLTSKPQTPQTPQTHKEPSLIIQSVLPQQEFWWNVTIFNEAGDVLREYRTKTFDWDKNKDPLTIYDPQGEAPKAYIFSNGRVIVEKVME